MERRVRLRLHQPQTFPPRMLIVSYTFRCRGLYPTKIYHISMYHSISVHLSRIYNIINLHVYFITNYFCSMKLKPFNFCLVTFGIFKTVLRSVQMVFLEYNSRDMFSSVPKVLPSLIHSTLGAGSPPNHKSYRIGRPFLTVRSLIPSPIICGGTILKQKHTNQFLAYSLFMGRKHL